MANNSEVKVTYKVLNSEFNKGIAEMSKSVTTLNKEFKLQQEQMRLSASETEKLEAKLTKLSSEYEIAQQKTKLTEQALQEVTKLTGENSKETQAWSNKLLDAKKNEEYLKNAITQTSQALNKERQATSQAAQESEKRKQSLSQLKSEQEALANKSDQITAKYKLENAELGNNASKSAQLKLKKKELAEQLENTAAQVKNLESQLELSKAEYGENSAEVNKLEKKLLEAKTAYQEFSNEMAKANDTAGQVSQKLQTVGSSITDVGNKWTLGVTTPIIGIGTAAASTAASFEQQMNRVKAISGATGSEFEKLEQQAIELGASSVFSATEVGQAQENMASAGFDAKTIYEAMPGVMALAAVSGGDMALSAEAVATAMNQFGIEASQSSHVADIFAEAAARTNAETSDMAEALKYAGPVAGSFGLTLEETAAAIGIMSNAGIKGSQAGTTLRTSMQRLADPTDEAKAVMEELGLEFFDSSGQMKSLSEITAILQDKMSGLTDEQKSAALSTLFGKESMTGMLALVDSAPGTIDNLTTSLVNSEGASQKMADTINSGMAGAFENLKGALESAGIAIGKALAPVIEDVTDKITDLVNWFNSLDESTQTTIVTIAGIVAAVGPVLVIIGSVISAIGKIVALFGSGGAIASIVTWITGTLIPAITGIVATVGALPLAIAAIVALIVAYVVTHWDQIKEYLSNFWTWLTELFGNLGEWFGEKWQAVKDKTVEIWDGIKTVFTTVWQSISDFFTGAWQAFSDYTGITWQGISDFFSGIWDGISSTVQTIWNMISSFFTAIWNAISSTATSIFTGVMNFFSSTWTSISSTASSIWNGISAFLSGLWNGIKSTVSSIWTGISSTISSVWNTISSTTSSIWNGIKSSISNTWNGIKSTVSSAVNGISSGISSGFNVAKNTVSNIFDGIKNAISSKINGAKSAVSSAISAIRSAFNFSWHLPHLKLPHLSIRGKFSINPPSVPHFGISWYKKGGIMTDPTVFGRNGNNLMVGGEAGPEAILPLTSKVLGSIGAGIVKASNIANNSYGNNTINVYADVASDYDVNRMIEMIDEGLGQRELDLSRGVGG